MLLCDFISISPISFYVYLENNNTNKNTQGSYETTAYRFFLLLFLFKILRIKKLV